MYVPVEHTTRKCTPGDSTPVISNSFIKTFRFAFQIISRRGSTKSECSGIFFFPGHVLIYLFGKFPGADDQQSSCQRVKRSRVTNFFHPDQMADLSYHIK